jgi:hypothetical protein
VPERGSVDIFAVRVIITGRVGTSNVKNAATAMAVYVAAGAGSATMAGVRVCFCGVAFTGWYRSLPTRFTAFTDTPIDLAILCTFSPAQMRRSTSAAISGDNLHCCLPSGMLVSTIFGLLAMGVLLIFGRFAGFFGLSGAGGRLCRYGFSHGLYGWPSYTRVSARFTLDKAKIRSGSTVTPLVGSR